MKKTADILNNIKELPFTGKIKGFTILSNTDTHLILINNITKQKIIITH